MKFKLKKVREQLQLQQQQQGGISSSTTMGEKAPTSPLLEEVMLDRYCSDADKEMDMFCECLQKCTTVKKVKFSTDFLMRMEDETVLKFFNALGKLTALQHLTIKSTSKFHIESIPVEGLLQLRHTPNLQTLELMDMQVTAEQKPFLHALAKTLEGHPTLTKVKAPNFFANDYTNTTDNILDPVIGSFKTIPHIEELELSGCGSHAMNDQKHVSLVSQKSLRELFEQTSTTLQSLQLSFLEFDDDYFADLSTVLPKEGTKSSSLHTLILDYHELGSVGFQHMMKAMETNDTIKTLSLRSLRDIGCDGFAHAMKMLQLNYKIETLSVTTTPSEQAEIDLYLRMNTAGRRLLRDQKVSLREWVDILARHSDDIDVTRNLIQVIPGLCNVNVEDDEHGHHDSCGSSNSNSKDKTEGSVESWSEHRGASPISTVVGTS
mmetsp:Transcript_12590/g.30480  ORF Transcript_12590/g.30480 Transcript_12590/m.30480 type:complete len:434 (+) Transcript_12590:442-1743(+)